MKIKGKYSESEKLHFIILGAAAGAAIIVFVVVLLILSNGKLSFAQEKAPEQTTTTTTTAAAAVTEPEDAGYQPDPEIKEEMKDAVTKLISGNYTVLKLYYIKGMAHKDEPYGNTPEDGYYTVDSEDYTSIDQLEDIVDSTFVKDFAKNVKNDPLGYGPIYSTRPNGTLGIIANFTPMPYTRSWKNPDFVIEPESDTECGIKIYIHEKDEAQTPVTLDGHMTKTADGWRLDSIIY